MEQVEARIARLPRLHLLGHAYRGVGINECIKHAIELAAAVPSG
jgi:oxygen-dependent protoporphyrinogen oxidase